MPIYEYECRGCGHRFEYLVLPSLPAAECPACQKKDLEQLISLCSVSSESSRQANLNAAHKRAAVGRNQKMQDEHKEYHEHFNDLRSTAG
jgi:putative FmdB family regulatory protein